jgi:hypothetical protein
MSAPSGISPEGDSGRLPVKRRKFRPLQSPEEFLKYRKHGLKKAKFYKAAHAHGQKSLKRKRFYEQKAKGN